MVVVEAAKEVDAVEVVNNLRVALAELVGEVSAAEAVMVEVWVVWG
eukprot:CAMPEP_0174732766 /NCGR_PEP_ID=MMETSP1094-20130205/59993_1 /TAXON_ID=156173 /ORGANISM="Chrysochromulina brevifilum, Strain UTEX LB 985" /LENGTH=45 /DNA_ID= /DNA_START= /DNA_END= /DNA_ORIENTATION=